MAICVLPGSSIAYVSTGHRIAGAIAALFPDGLLTIEAETEPGRSILYVSTGYDLASGPAC
eukprot:3941399-Rhodomonas_salina.11